jgi:hypothetical protein
MSTRASPGTASAVLVAALVLGFGGGAFAGNLGTGSEASAGSLPAAATASPTPSTPASSVSLSAPQTSVGANEKIDMTGRLDGGDWSVFPDADDPVTVTTRDDGSFSTYVITGRVGQNQFRVVGQVGDERLESEPVTITIS